MRTNTPPPEEPRNRRRRLLIDVVDPRRTAAELPASPPPGNSSKAFLYAGLSAAALVAATVAVVLSRSDDTKTGSEDLGAAISEGQNALRGDTTSHESFGPLPLRESAERLKKSSVQLVLSVDGAEQTVPAVMVKKNIFATASSNFPQGHAAFMKRVEGTSGTVWSAEDDSGKLKDGFGSMASELSSIPGVTFVVTEGAVEKGAPDVNNAVSVTLPAAGERVRLGFFSDQWNQIFSGTFLGETTPGSGLFVVQVPGFHGNPGQGIFNADDELIGVVVSAEQGRVVFSPLGKKVDDEEEGPETPSDLAGLHGEPPPEGPTYELDPKLFPPPEVADAHTPEVKPQGKDQKLPKAEKKSSQHHKTRVKIPHKKTKKPTPEELEAAKAEAEKRAEEQQQKAAERAEQKKQAEEERAQERAAKIEAKRRAAEALREARDRAALEAQMRARENARIAQEAKDRAASEARYRAYQEAIRRGDYLTPGSGGVHGLGKIPIDGTVRPTGPGVSVGCIDPEGCKTQTQQFLDKTKLGRPKGLGRIDTGGGNSIAEHERRVRAKIQRILQQQKGKKK